MSPAISLKPKAAPGGEMPFSAAAWLAANTAPVAVSPPQTLAPSAPVASAKQVSAPARPASVAPSAAPVPSNAEAGSARASARWDKANAKVEAESNPGATYSNARMILDAQAAQGGRGASATDAASAAGRWDKANAKIERERAPVTTDPRSKAARILANQRAITGKGRN